MKQLLITTILLVHTLVGSTCFAQNGLFDKEEPLKIRLVADLVALVNDKSEDPEYTSAKLILYLPNLKINSFSVQVKARGNTRRVTGLCEFPPLKFNFKKKEAQNTVFEGQDKIKFVSQCKLESEYKNYLLEEYLLYKTYGLLSEYSYKTRLVEIEIIDHDLRMASVKMTGFLIEDKKAFAKRISARKYEGQLYAKDSSLHESSETLTMYQFMIGNTDWYINTRHNIDIYQSKADGSLIAVPFDFDFSGVINAEYAAPSKQVPIKHVTERYYKGDRRGNLNYARTVGLFNDKKDRVYALYSSFNILPKARIKKSIKYYDKFYEIVNAPSLARTAYFNEEDSIEKYGQRMLEEAN